MRPATTPSGAFVQVPAGYPRGHLIDLKLLAPRTGGAMFEEALRKLRDLQRRAKASDGEHRVEFGQLFPDDFMLLNTDFQSIADLFSASGFVVESSEDFEAAHKPRRKRLH